MVIYNSSLCADGAPRLSSNKNLFVVLGGSSFDINCTSINDINWMHEGQPAQQQGNTVVRESRTSDNTENISTLSIQALTSANSGSYRCQEPAEDIEFTLKVLTGLCGITSCFPCFDTFFFISTIKLYLVHY